MFLPGLRRSAGQLSWLPCCDACGLLRPITRASRGLVRSVVLKARSRCRRPVCHTWRMRTINGYQVGPGARLHGADLTAANLSRCDFTGADLSDAKLMRSDLTGSILFGTDLRRADLRTADLSGAKLNRADLSFANLSGANLCQADLSNAVVTGAVLTGANLEGVVGLDAGSPHN